MMTEKTEMNAQILMITRMLLWRKKKKRRGELGVVSEIMLCGLLNLLNGSSQVTREKCCQQEGFLYIGELQR